MTLDIKKISVILGIITSVALIVSGIYKHFDNKFISTSELGTILLLQQANDDELLKAIKTLGGSFYAATILDLDNAINILEDKSKNTALTQNEINQLNLLKGFRSNIKSDKDNLSNITTKPIDLGHLPE